MPADIPSGNGIVATRPEGMTAKDAARGEPAAAQGTVSLESLSFYLAQGEGSHE